MQTEKKRFWPLLLPLVPILGLVIALCALGGIYIWLENIPTEAPGQGREAGQAYQAAAPLIAALEQFKDDRGAYPQDLAELQPAYLETLPTQDELPGLTYETAAESYILTFTYSNPDLNHCEYSPESEWSCSSYH